MPLTLKEIVEKSPKRANNPSEFLLGIDPGETTGWCIIESKNYTLAESGQFKSSFKNLEYIIGQAAAFGATAIVESYRLYPWKLQDQTWSDLYTPRLIGTIEYLLYEWEIPVIFQTAQQGKSFCSNDRLKEWGLYKSSIKGVSQKHANDSCRHPASYLLFGRDMKAELLVGNYNTRLAKKEKEK